MTPEQLSAVILSGVGVALQLAFMYFPKFSDWYQSHPNKGLIALAFDVAFGAAYFGLACVPFLADLLKIGLACNAADGFVLLQAIFMIAVSQLGTFLFLKKQVKNKQFKLGVG
jgi:hypothetical protein